MSVRPITTSEEKMAWGAPWSGYLTLFGASQGLLTHLRMNGIPLKGSWMPNTMSKFTLPLLLVGGAAAGAGVSTFCFGDEGLRRLHTSH